LAKAAVISGLSPGQPGYLGALQREITTEWNKVSSEEKEKFQVLANEWSSGQAPDDVKRRQVIPSYSIIGTCAYPSTHRMAHSMCKRIIQDFQTQLFKSCGVRSLVLTSYVDLEKNVKGGM
jgi:hypothetical protein